MRDDKLQQAQDMLRALENQRNAAQNECVQLAAQLLAAQRRIAELEKAQQEQTPTRATNGHDMEEARPAA